MAYVHLLIVVLAMLTTALVARSAAQRGVGAIDLAATMFVVSAFLGGFLLWRHGVFQTAANSRLIVYAAMAGVGGSGAVVAFNQAVKVGHFGFSNTIYRASFLPAVIYSALFLGQHWTVGIGVGVGLVLVSIFLMSWSDGVFRKNGKTIWFVLIVTAFVLSSLPRIGQELTVAARGNKLQYIFYSYAFGSMVLLVALGVVRRFQMAAILWGSLSAVASLLGVYCTMVALETLKPHVVFPVSLTGAVILGALFSWSFFKEKIRGLGWLGIGSGIAGILVITLNQ
jgi:uncharacterized membrane protein